MVIPFFNSSQGWFHFSNVNCIRWYVVLHCLKSLFKFWEKIIFRVFISDFGFVYHLENGIIILSLKKKTHLLIYSLYKRVSCGILTSHSIWKCGGFVCPNKILVKFDFYFYFLNGLVGGNRHDNPPFRFFNLLSSLLYYLPTFKIEHYHIIIS